MAEKWLFEPNQQRLASFQEYLLQLAEGPGYRTVVNLQLAEIQEDPVRSGTAFFVDDDLVYLRTTGHYGPPLDVVPLLLAYQLEVKARIIHPFLVCKAAAVYIIGSPPPSTAALTPEPVENLIRRALQRAERLQWH